MINKNAITHTEYETAIAIHDFAKGKIDNIEKELKESRILDICNAYKFRVKEKDKIVEKVIRKQKDKSYGICDITDIIGIRLITIFPYEMLDVYTKLLQYINDADKKIVYSMVILMKPSSILEMLLKKDLSEHLKRLHVIMELNVSLPVRQRKKGILVFT